MKVLLSEAGAFAAERVRKRDGDRSPTATVNRLIHESDRGPCAQTRGDGRPCGAPIYAGASVCLGCLGDPPKRARKGAK